MRLTEAAYRLARKLGILIEGELSSAASTTVMADNLLLPAYGDDYFNRGTMWMTVDDNANIEGPELQARIVTDFAQSGGSATVTPAFTTSPAAADKYAISTAEYSLATLQMAVSQAMLNLGKIPFVDTSLSTAANQTEYTLPAAVFAPDLREVWIQGNTSDANDNAWVLVHDWYTAETGTDTADTLIFRSQPTTGRTIKLVYVDEAPYVGDVLSTQSHSASDKIPETIPEDTLIAEAVVEALYWKAQQPGTKDREFWRLLERREKQAEQWKMMNPVRRPRKRGDDLMIVDSNRYGNRGRYGEYIP